MNKGKKGGTLYCVFHVVSRPTSQGSRFPDDFAKGNCVTENCPFWDEVEKKCSIALFVKNASVWLKSE
ncbi:unnamed protein product [marine sediment metagenome]|uniref:Uncharacterized protein n=1 Tax=marine sediment metagenome TaxID=412755 RepID=X1PQT9_9ZZZZ